MALLEYVQKHIHERDIDIHLPNIPWLMEKNKLSKELVVCFMRYLMQEGDALDPKAFFRILEQSTPRYREDMMTIAEYLEQKGHKIGQQIGHQEGKQERRQEERSEIARNLLSIGLDRAAIVRATGLNNAELDALAGQSR